MGVFESVRKGTLSSEATMLSNSHVGLHGPLLAFPEDVRLQRLPHLRRPPPHPPRRVRPYPGVGQQEHRGKGKAQDEHALGGLDVHAAGGVVVDVAVVRLLGIRTRNRVRKKKNKLFCRTLILISTRVVTVMTAPSAAAITSFGSGMGKLRRALVDGTGGTLLDDGLPSRRIRSLRTRFRKQLTSIKTLREKPTKNTRVLRSLCCF